MHDNVTSLSMHVNFVLMFRMTRLAAKDMKKLSAVQSFLDELNLKKQPAHTIGGYTLLRSKPGCVMQGEHTDFFVNPKKDRMSGKDTPHVGLIALENSTTLQVEGQKVVVPKGSCLIMRGSVLHAGSDYDVDNIRFHFYMDTPHYVASGGTHTQWKECKSEGKVQRK